MKLLILVYKKPLKILIWLLETDDFVSINQRQSAVNDGVMFGYCPSKIEILIDFGEYCGILEYLKEEINIFIYHC